MAKLQKDLGAGGNLHPRESLYVTGSLGALNAEVIVATDGASTISLDLRGTFTLAVEVSGTIDGTNWILIPIRSIFGGSYLIGVASGTGPGAWVAACAGFRQVRARVTGYTSGAATAFIVASTGILDDALNGEISTSAGTITAAAAAAATLTLAAPGVGLRHYITGIYIDRHTSALLTAAATPVVITTTNLPGSLAFSIPADAAPQGQVYKEKFEPTRAIMASAQNTATTIVAGAIAGVIWRITALFYVAP